MRVFVLSTGRCGTTTFTYACKHMTNFTAGHESRARYIGSERLDYPDGHIEIDNRLSWFLGRLEQAYGSDPYFVHLTREKSEVARSYAARMNNPSSIGSGHKTSILMDAPYDDLDICLDVTETMLANIEQFLRDKPNVMKVSLESIEDDFSRFWDWIGADGDKAAALLEWKTLYNDSRRNYGQIKQAARPTTELSELRERCRTLSAKNRRLSAEVASESGKFEYADRLYRETAVKLWKRERRLARTEARCNRIESLGKRQMLKFRRDIEERDRLVGRLRREAHAAERKLGSMRDAVRKHLKERAEIIKYADELESRYRNVLASRSWRVMGPYRFVMRKVREAILGHAIPRNSLPTKPVVDVRPGNDTTTNDLHDSRRELSVRAVDDKLWGGFSRSAFPHLSAIRSDSEKPSRVRGDAAYRLARWHSVNGDVEKALEEIRAMRTIYPPSAEEPQQFIPEALFLCRLGEVEEARKLLESHREGFNPTIQLMLANTWNPAISGVRTDAAEAKTLEYLNSIYAKFDLGFVEKRDPSAPLSIDNIRGVPSTLPELHGQEYVTVIVPVFNAQETIVTALTSIADQTWRNLEVLVVDDASTDGSVDIIEDYCRRDSRFRLIRSKENVGSYVCRNRALEIANGDFITVHDSDDWSHPDKIRCQVESFRRNPAPYNLAMWVRTTSELAFLGNSRTLHNLVRADHSSGFFPRESLRQYGAWDAVRVSADTELFWRIESALGNKKWMLNRRQILEECPLAFGRMSDTSLTQAAATQVMTIYHGVRREYRDAADCWHSYVRDVKDIRPSARRKSFFPVPTLIAPEAESPCALSTLLIADWNAPDMLERGTRLLQQAALTGSAGLFHYPRYGSDVTAPLNQSLRRFAWETGIRVIAPGEVARVGRVIVAGASVFEHALDRFPQIEYERLLVVSGSEWEASHGVRTAGFDEDLVRGHLVEFFGAAGEWVPSLEEALDSASGHSPGGAVVKGAAPAGEAAGGRA